MGLKLKREHPPGMIDLMKVDMSMTMDEPTRLFMNERLKGQGIGKLKRNHHILIIDMGEKDDS